MKTYREPCGCVAERERERYVALCPPHAAEWREMHERALADHRNRDTGLDPRPQVAVDN